MTDGITEMLREQRAETASAVTRCPGCGRPSDQDHSPDCKTVAAFRMQADRLIPEYKCPGCGSTSDRVHRPDCETLARLDGDDYSGKARHAAMESLIWDLLDPEMYGYAVTAEVRDRARRCVGIKPCETVRK